jgi:hypothetical protein
MAPVMKGYDGKMRWMESVEKKLPRGGQVFSFNLVNAPLFSCVGFPK